MKIAIVGSREGIAPGVVEAFVEKLAAKYPEAIIVSGGARGVDSDAERAAVWNGLDTLVFPADWNTHGRSAGYKRNVQIVEAADVLVAFTTGSRGTAHSIELAKAKGIPVFVYDPNGERVFVALRGVRAEWEKD